MWEQGIWCSSQTSPKLTTQLPDPIPSASMDGEPSTPRTTTKLVGPTHHAPRVRSHGEPTRDLSARDLSVSHSTHLREAFCRHHEVCAGQQVVQPLPRLLRVHEHRKAHGLGLQGRDGNMERKEKVECWIERKKSTCDERPAPLKTSLHERALSLVAGNQGSWGHAHKAKTGSAWLDTGPALDPQCRQASQCAWGIDHRACRG